MFFNNKFRILKLQAIVINISNGIIAQTFKSTLNIYGKLYVPFEVRKKVHKKSTTFSQTNMKLFYILFYH